MYDLWFLPFAARSTLPAVRDRFPEDRCTYQLFTRAHALVESRAFKIDHEIILAPFADMANHRPPASAQRNLRARGWALDGAEEKGLELYVAGRDVAPGEELCISYGALPNWQLLLHYGFALPDNPDERVVVSLELPDGDGLQLYTFKMLFLGMEGADHLDVDHALTVADPLPDGLVASTRLLLLDDAESAGVSVASADFRKPLSVRNERAVVSQLSNLVERMLSGFDVFEREEDAPEQDFAAFCATYVNGQRDILDRAFDALQRLAKEIPPM